VEHTQQGTAWFPGEEKEADKFFTIKDIIRLPSGEDIESLYEGGPHGSLR
jgi:hypothetical protein